MDFSLLMTLAVIHCVALISPGPDFAIVVKIATQEARATALAAAVGISVAILLHSILSLTGLSLIIQSSPALYLLVQILGASYLGWMGIGALRSAWNSLRPKLTRTETEVVAESMGTMASSDTDAATAEPWAKLPNSDTAASLGATVPMAPLQGFIKGLYTNLLNPKALVFFLTLFSALLTAQITVATKVAAALLLLLLSLLWFGSLALVLSRPAIQRRLQRQMPGIDALIGLVFVAVALAIFVDLLA
jgi:threonine efflux protein